MRYRCPRRRAVVAAAPILRDVLLRLPRGDAGARAKPGPARFRVLILRRAARFLFGQLRVTVSTPA